MATPKPPRADQPKLPVERRSGPEKPAPVNPRSGPAPEVTHCVFCGKRLSPETVANCRGACDECSSPVGKMVEIWVNLRTKEQYAGTRFKVSDYFETLPTWQAIQHFARQKFAHPKFTTETWTALQHWLSAERDIGEEAFLRMTPTAVEQLLRDDAKAALSAPAITPPAAPASDSKPGDEITGQQSPRGRKPKLVDPQENDIRRVYADCRNIKATVERLRLKTLRRVTAHLRVQRIVNRDKRPKSRVKKLVTIALVKAQE